MGDFARFCKSTDKSSGSKPFTKEGKTSRKQQKSVKCVSDESESVYQELEECLGIYNVSPGQNSKDGYFEFVQVSGKNIQMQIDTGTDHTIMCKSTYCSVSARRISHFLD